MSVHRMTCQGENAAEVLFVCNDEQCGRRIVVGKARPRLVVLDQGDLSASHLGSLGGVVIDNVDAA
jgi:hypothetical protein